MNSIKKRRRVSKMNKKDKKKKFIPTFNFNRQGKVKSEKRVILDKRGSLTSLVN